MNQTDRWLGGERGGSWSRARRGYRWVRDTKGRYYLVPERRAEVRGVRRDVSGVYGWPAPSDQFTLPDVPYGLHREIAGLVYDQGDQAPSHPDFRVSHITSEDHAEGRDGDDEDARPPPDPDAKLRRDIVEFAKRYGPLGVRRASFEPWNARGNSREGEPYEDWKAALCEIAALVELWDIVRRKDERKLRSVFVWEKKDEPSVLMWFPTTVCRRSERLASRGRDGRSESLLEEYGAAPDARQGTAAGRRFQALRTEYEKDPVAVAWRVLRTRLNRALSRGVVSPQLAQPYPDRGRGEGMLATRDLRSMALIQLYEEIVGTRRFVPCAGPRCGRWIDMTGRRSDVRYCGEACQKRQRRERRPRGMAPCARQGCTNDFPERTNKRSCSDACRIAGHRATHAPGDG